MLSKRNLIILGIIVILLLLGISFWVFTRPSEPVEKPIEPEVVPKEIPPLASGKQTFEILTNVAKTFRIIEAEVDPLDVKQGETQQVWVLVKDFEDKPITQENKVEGTVFTDNKTTPFSFELKEVSDANGATLTFWQSSWVLEDTYDNIYMINITAKSADREHAIDLTFR